MVLVISFFPLLLDLFHCRFDLRINLGLKASFYFNIQNQVVVDSLGYLQKTLGFHMEMLKEMSLGSPVTGESNPLPIVRTPGPSVAGS